jgi:ankyrin repeat protein
MTRFGTGCAAAALVMTATIAAAQTGARDLRVVAAAKAGDRAAVRAALAQKADVNAAEPDGTTALHWAARADDRETVDLLLRAGARVDAVNRYGVTPLALAAENGSAAMAQALLTAGADPNAVVGAGQTPLMTAARTGSLETVRLLLARGANVNAKEGGLGHSALMFAAIENHPAVVQALAEAGAELDATSNLIETPDINPGKGIASDGARGAFPKGALTPLLLAARHGSIDAIGALVKAGAKIDQPQVDGITPLIMAIFNGHYDAAAALVELGADPSLADGSNRTPLYTAVDMHTLEWLFSRPTPPPSGALDSVDVVKLLLAKGVNPDPKLTKRPTAIGIGGSGHNASLTPGSTPLMKAATTSDVELVKILLDAGADPNLTTDNHTTPLMMAAGLNWRDIGSLGTDEESLEVIRLLMARGADVNAFNDDGQTALHGAAQRGSLPVIRFLLDQNAKLTPKNKRGRTPLDEAIGDEGLNGERRQSRPEAVALLGKLAATTSNARSQ